MGVPKEIRIVERPKNTIVYEIKNGLYGVRERSGVKYVNSKPQPINGKVVGHIINNKYIPITEKIAKVPMFLSFGSSSLIKSLSNDIYDDLLAIYPIDTAKKIITMASIKIIKPSIKCNRYSKEYERTFLSLYYPDCHLSKNTICDLLNDIGIDSSKRELFFNKRIERIPNNHLIAIDGTLRQDSSVVNSLSGFSYKSRIKNTKEVSILYAYDIESLEPICSTIFPGNSIDASSYRQFITENSIKKGIIVSDKGFPPSKIKDIVEDNADLHFLTPIRRNDKRIEQYNMLSFEEAITGIEKDVIGKKHKIKNEQYLYSFLDVTTMGREFHDYINNAKQNKDFDMNTINEKKNRFGIIVLESDLDMSLQDAYLCYQERWKIELVFRAYKNDIEITETNVRGDYSVIGMEFINFISTIITTRVIEELRKANLLNKHTYGEIMDDLTSAWRKDNNIKDKPSINDGLWINTLPSVFEIMKSLNMLKESKEKIKRGRGRPKKSAKSSH